MQRSLERQIAVLLLTVLGATLAGCDRKPPASTMSETPPEATPAAVDDSRHPVQDSPGKAEPFGKDVEATASTTPEMPPDPVPATTQDYRQQIQELYKKVKGSGEDMSSDVAVSIQELYERARDSGEDVSSSVRDWAQADVKRIGTWDYMIVSIEAQSPEDGLLAKLKELGEQRWECFWVEKTAGGNRLYMKRPRRSYIQMATRAAKFIPVPSGNE